jgi:nucleotide-binding universal stress UspA family protein
MFRHIVHANDGSEGSYKAFEAALRMATLCGARLDVLFVEELSPQSGGIADVEARKAIEDRRFRAARSRMEGISRMHAAKYETHMLMGHPVTRIVDFVHDQKADLLVIGATEHASFVELLFGRRSDRIAHLATCSVLIAR